ncbi:hypothetical protein DFJ63DRAFT_310995 [Scheffersomyces coipomensis]|uniref:uncharacterized protein n=1 Tax=Scheffersomyces coipomensis TaxID=1788519 RepID=UPI00315DB59C
MDYNGQFLSRYFLAFPNDIIIDIIDDLPTSRIQFLMNTSLFEPPVYDEFIDDIILSTNHPNLNRYMTSTINTLTESIYVRRLPPNYVPQSILISTSQHAIKQVLHDDAKILKIIKYIKIRLRYDLSVYGAQISIPNDILHLSNLTRLEMKFYNRSTKQMIFAQFNIEKPKAKEQLPKTLAKTQNFKYVLEQLESTLVDYLIVEHLPELKQFHHFRNLQSLTIKHGEFDSPIKIPISLERMFFESCKFKDIVQHFSWPERGKYINLKMCSGYESSDISQIELSNWPIHLTDLKLKYNNFKHDLLITNLPSSLECLEIIGKVPYDISLNEQSIPEITFPESLETIMLTSVKLYNSTESKIIFPQMLSDLTLSNCLHSIKQCLFPPSLTTLILNNNSIQSLEEYNDSQFNKHWNQLINLTTLELDTNCIPHEGIVDWLPPPNVKYLDISQ